MASLIRTLLVWLLVLAVPARAAVVATMAFCGPHHDGRGTATLVQQPAAEHAHHGDVAQARGHGDATAQSDKVASTSSDAASLPKVIDLSKHKCSACASCCSAPAIVDTAPAVPAPAVSPTVFPALTPSVDSFAADGPDRPPRTILA